MHLLTTAWMNRERGSERSLRKPGAVRCTCVIGIHFPLLPASSYYISLIPVCLFFCHHKKTSSSDKPTLSVSVIIITTSYKKKRRRPLVWLSALIYGKQEFIISDSRAWRLLFFFFLFFFAIFGADLHFFISSRVSDRQPPANVVLH